MSRSYNPSVILSKIGALKMSKKSTKCTKVSKLKSSLPVISNALVSRLFFSAYKNAHWLLLLLSARNNRRGVMYETSMCRHRAKTRNRFHPLSRPTFAVLRRSIAESRSGSECKLPRFPSSGSVEMGFPFKCVTKWATFTF